MRGRAGDDGNVHFSRFFQHARRVSIHLSFPFWELYYCIVPTTLHPPPRLWVVANVRIGQARSSTAVGRPKKRKSIPRQLTREAIAFLWACLVVVRAPRGEAVDGGAREERMEES
jgi:hypothetical protein